MNELQLQLDNYLSFCRFQRRLDNKTLKAYRIDLTQFSQNISATYVSDVNVPMLEQYIAFLHQQYKPKTVKRKIASIKAFFHYLEYKDIIGITPFNKLQTRFREPVILPKIIPLGSIEALLCTIYAQEQVVNTPLQKRFLYRDEAIIELLFATGIRISELCSLKPQDINLTDCVVLIFGKGAKERRIQLGNEAVISALEKYYSAFSIEIQSSEYFFINKLGSRLSEQSVRRMLNKYVSLAGINQHITPHMFRHSFATYLLEADVDIRYIQELLGHSSINITEIYTHVATAKQKNILTTKHPRKDLNV